MPHDLSSALAALHNGRLSAADALAQNRLAAEAPDARAAFIRLFRDSAMATAAAADSLAHSGVPRSVLGGLAISIKDLFDVAGAPTTAGSRVLADAPPAAKDCAAVARLRQAGAALIGHTHMSEFAFSGVGINPAPRRVVEPGDPGD